MAFHKPLLLFYALCCLFFGVFTGFSQAHAAEDIVLAKQPGAAVTEMGLPTLECAFTDMQMTYRYEDVPWKRAQRGTKMGDYDGFFMASRNQWRDEFAVASTPFVFNDWVYVVHPDVKLKPGDKGFQNLRFGANIGTARYYWLRRKIKKQNWPHAIQGADEIDSMWRMIDARRVDVLLENRSNLDVYRKNYDPEGRFGIHAARHAQLAVYFSKAYLAKHPDFLDRFNASITGCMTE